MLSVSGKEAGAIKHPKKRKKRAGVLTGIILLMLLFAVGIQLYQMQAQLQAARAQEAALAEQIAAVEAENQALSDALENSDDPELIQEIARTQLGMVEKNEKVFYDIGG